MSRSSSRRYNALFVTLRSLSNCSQVDFTTYKSDGNHRDAAVIRRYAIQKPDDYRKYNTICGSLRQLAHKLSDLDPSDPFRRKHEDLMLEKLFAMGILGTGGGGKGKLYVLSRYNLSVLLQDHGEMPLQDVLLYTCTLQNCH
jgi:hypothetical protein